MLVPFDFDYVQEGCELGINIDSITREGHRVRLVEFDGISGGSDYPLLGYDLDSKDPSTIRSWKRNGTYFREGFEHPRDLIYINI